MAKQPDSKLKELRKVIVEVQPDGQISVVSNVQNMEWVAQTLYGALTAVGVNMQKPGFEMKPQDQTPPFSKN
jgi:hypothetical protein